MKVSLLRSFVMNNKTLLQTYCSSGALIKLINIQHMDINRRSNKVLKLKYLVFGLKLSN